MCQSETIVINQGTGWRRYVRCKNFCFAYFRPTGLPPRSDCIQEYYEQSAIKAGWRFRDSEWLCPTCAPTEFKNGE